MNLLVCFTVIVLKMCNFAANTNYLQKTTIMKKLLLSLLLFATAAGSFAQRVTDKLDRGLIAQKATVGV